MVIDNEILISSEPGFETCNKLDASVAYFVVCKKNEHLIGGIDAYNQIVAGEKIISWVARACDNAKILEINDYQNEIDAVLPCIDGSEYTVILKGNIPLVMKQHLKDMLNFVMHRHMNACKLKGGYIFKTEYLKEVGKVLSADCYNHQANDFFAVVDYDSLTFAREEISRRIYSYHSKNGVDFAGFDSCGIDANVQIGYGSSFGLGAKILHGSKILNDVSVGEYSVIESSLVKDNTIIGCGAIIKKCVIGLSCKIGDGVVLKNCKIGDGTIIEDGSRIFDCQIDRGVKINKLCDIASSNISANASIGAMSRLYNAFIEQSYEVFDGKVIIKRAEEE